MDNTQRRQGREITRELEIALKQNNMHDAEDAIRVLSMLLKRMYERADTNEQKSLVKITVMLSIFSELIKKETGAPEKRRQKEMKRELMVLQKFFGNSQAIIDITTIFETVRAMHQAKEKKPSEMQFVSRVLHALSEEYPEEKISLQHCSLVLNSEATSEEEYHDILSIAERELLKIIDRVGKE